MSPQIHAFVWEHRLDDPHRLALAPAGFFPEGLAPSAAAAQVSALQKVRRKIPLWHRPGLWFPPGISLEQASSEPTARFKAGLFAGATAADLTGGLGVDSFFLAQHFARVVCVEPNAGLLETVRENFAALGQTNVRFENSTAEDFLKNSAENFDLIYLDPSRRDARKGKVFQFSDCSPDVAALRGNLLRRSPRVLVKASPMLDIQLAMRQLENVSQVWAVESDGDCREVLYLLEREKTPPDAARITAVFLDGEQAPGFFEFTFSEENAGEAPLGPPEKFLFEPGPALLKTGAFRSFARRFGLTKLHPNTHLYTAAERPGGVPGRAFLIEKICRYDRKTMLAALGGEGGGGAAAARRANVAVRNFPDSAEAVRKKLGLADGGDVYVFGVRDFEGRPLVLVCRKAE